jgi:hypothetical protein
VSDTEWSSRGLVLIIYCFHSHPYGKHSQSDTLVLFHDAFQNLSYWTEFNDPKYKGAAFDTHIYTVFSEDVSISEMLWMEPG